MTHASNRSSIASLFRPIEPAAAKTRNFRRISWIALAGPFSFLLGVILLAPATAQDFFGQGETAEPAAERKLSSDEEAFRQLLEGAKLTGRFTTDGQDLADTRDESYEIRNVRKLDDVDLWGLEARVRYGGRDMTVPVGIQVQFAAGVPVIVLRDVTIPGMGTFSAAVVFHKGRYAGSWQHDDKGGHLYGLVTKSDSAE